MVQTADFRKGHHAPFRWRVDAARRGRVLPEGEMRSSPVMVAEIRRKEPAKVCAADNDYVIQAFAADGSD
jgi:hypothetical protein